MAIIALVNISSVWITCLCLEYIVDLYIALLLNVGMFRFKVIDEWITVG